MAIAIPPATMLQERKHSGLLVHTAIELFMIAFFSLPLMSMGCVRCPHHMIAWCRDMCLHTLMHSHHHDDYSVIVSEQQTAAFSTAESPTLLTPTFHIIIHLAPGCKRKHSKLVLPYYS